MTLAHNPRPRSVTYAVRLMYTGAALTLAGGVAGALLSAHSIAAATLASERHTLEMRNVHATLPSVDLMTHILAIGLIVSGVIEALLWLWMAWKNGQGRSWARVLSTAFFTVLCLFEIISLLEQTASASGIRPGIGTALLGLATLAVALITIILLWRRESTAYYQAVKMRHTGTGPIVRG